MLTGPEALFLITAYSTGHINGRLCGATGLTRDGSVPKHQVTVAVDPSVIPLGSLLHIEGIGLRIAQDTGRLIKGQHLDLFVPSCKVALHWGARKKRVRVIRKGYPLHHKTLNRRKH